MRIGLDLGGTKTEIICLDQHNGKELYRQRIPTARGDYQVTVRTLSDLVQQAEQTLGMTGTVGIGIPGTVSSVTGLVKNANSTWINGHPLDKDVSAVLGRPVKIQNDANCFAVSESVDGSAEGYRVVFGVIIGTGCGGGLCIDGRAQTGINGIGGEWGHNPLPYPRIYSENQDEILSRFEKAAGAVEAIPTYFSDSPATSEYPGPLCYCGKRGCQETWISGTGFKNDYRRVNGDDMSTHDIIAAAKTGEPKAVAALERYTDRLARALSVVINILDPDAIVLGGGMSNVASLYTDIPEIWGKYVFSDTIDTKLLSPRHGDSSGVRGAAWLWGKT
jgi:fructokinase